MKVEWDGAGRPGFIDGHAAGHGWQVIDLGGGRDVGRDVTWADEEEGLYEVLLRDADGNLVPTPCRNDVEREILAARLRIVPPPGSEELLAALLDAAAAPDVVVGG